MNGHRFDRRLSVLTALLVTITLSQVQAGTFPASNRAERRAVKARVHAAQFLSRTTFGFTEAQVEELAKKILDKGLKPALTEEIDAQLAMPQTNVESIALKMQTEDGYTDPYADAPSSLPGLLRNRFRYRDFAWWHAALNAPDQLRQRMAWALWQIAVINDRGGTFNDNRPDSVGPRYMAILVYHDMLARNAFGKYQDVLLDVTYSPAMGNFLSHINNLPPDPATGRFPDENFARELLQLLGIGVHKRKINGVFVKDKNGDLIDTYNNDDIKALSRVLTGLRYGNNNSFREFHLPMQMFSSRHDFNPKEFPTLGIALTNPPQTSEDLDGDGTAGDPDDNAMSEINEAVIAISRHPSAAPFVSRLLIQRFVNSNPSKPYIRRVARVYRDTDGDLASIIKAILLDRDALRSTRFKRVYLPGSQPLPGTLPDGLMAYSRGTEFSRLQEPVIRYTQMIRALGGVPAATLGNYSLPGFRIYPNTADTNQLPFKSPSVFNFYLPDYQPLGFESITPSRRIPNGQLYAPEMQIFTPVVANRFANLLDQHVHDAPLTTNTVALPDTSFEKWAALAGPGPEEDPLELLRRLDILLCHGSMSDATRDSIIEGMSASTNPLERAKSAVLAVLTSPDCAIDE